MKKFFLPLVLSFTLISCGPKAEEVWRLNPYSNVCKHIDYDYNQYILHLDHNSCHINYTYDYEDYYYSCEDQNNNTWYYFKNLYECIEFGGIIQ